MGICTGGAGTDAHNESGADFNRPTRLPKNLGCSLHKLTDTATAIVGDTIVYKYENVNTGAVTLTTINASDNKLGTIDFGVSELVPSAEANAQQTCTVVEGDLPGPLTNLAPVTGASSLNGAVVTTDTASVGLSHRPRIAVEKSANRSSTLQGETITYTYLVKNVGEVTVPALTATDNLLGVVTLAPSDVGAGSECNRHPDLHPKRKRPGWSDQCHRGNSTLKSMLETIHARTFE